MKDLTANRPLTIVSHSDDPYLNLALENYLLREENRHPILLLYINRPAIIMGRFQNPWQEVNFSKKPMNLDVVRRQSGGGTVYHDFGNLNYCFIHGDRDYQLEINQKIISHALASFALDVRYGKRGDIYIETQKGLRKISGSAFKQIKKRSFHHGTLLIDANLEHLQGILNPNHWEIQSRAVSSIPHPVINLKELSAQISLESCLESFQKSFESFFPQAEFLNLESAAIHGLKGVSRYAEQLQAPLWLWNETPRFEIKLPLHSKASSLVLVHKGRVISVDSKTEHPLVGEEFRSLIEEFY